MQITIKSQNLYKTSLLQSNNSLRRQMTNLHEKETALLKELNRKTEEHLKAQFLQKSLEKEKEFEHNLKVVQEDYEKRMLGNVQKLKEDFENKQKENEQLQNIVIDLRSRYICQKNF